MARRSRADSPGSWHHVVNRGISKRPLYETRTDARFFLARLVRQVRLGRIEIHAFCLMTTHFHLLVRSPVGELSEAMRRAQNEHSRRFNRLKRRDGALIRGRFFSKPVRSLQYRRALVRYIDGNPIKAGLVNSAEAYELGSAALYLSRSGPPWLSREWVEAEACEAADVERYTPEAYRVAFGVSDPVELLGVSELIEARFASAAEDDPFESLVGTAPRQVQAWMQRKAKLADGHRVGLPVCGQPALRRALEQDAAERGVWMVEEARRTWKGTQLAWPGLLRDLCGLSWQEIANLSDGSLSRARRLGAAHRRLLGSDPAYARRVAEVGHRALPKFLGRGGSEGGGEWLEP